MPNSFETSLSGALAPGSVHSVGSSDYSPPQKFAAPKRNTHKKVTPDDVRLVTQLNADHEKHALNDAEALWQTMTAPVYGDPTCLEEEFSELAIRFAKRGVRWVEIAQVYGVSAADRRVRSEHRAKVGYGRLKPDERAPVFPPAKISTSPKPNTSRL